MFKVTVTGKWNFSPDSIKEAMDLLSELENMSVPTYSKEQKWSDDPYIKYKTEVVEWPPFQTE